MLISFTSTAPKKGAPRRGIQGAIRRHAVGWRAAEYADGGYSLDDIVTLSKSLEAAGVIAIDLSGGTNETPELSRYCIQPPSFPRRASKKRLTPDRETSRLF
jgi:2,4-dienoyl-CoA reductase-like NADH-dependent reductase (Old Yellow Enzyme family)